MTTLPTVTNSEENERLALEIQKEKDRRRYFQMKFLTNLSRLGLKLETVNSYC